MAKSKAGVNKAQLVRDAITALGGDAKPAAIQEYIKGAGGPEIPTVMISSYKSNMKNKGGGGKPGRKKGGGRAGRPGRPAGATRGADIFSDISTVRGLLDKHGKPGLVKLIDAIG